MSAAPVCDVLDDAPAADLLGPLADPADAYADPSVKRVAFAVWVRQGKPWPPPAGLVSAIAGAAMVQGRRR
jgi:hypothetical protein